MRLVRYVLLPCIIFLAPGGCKPRAEREAILIGHLAPFSGQDKRIGEHARQAILLAVEEANKEENRVSGRRVAVLHVDLHGDLDALQPKAVRLITVNRVVALLGGVSVAQVERLGHAAQPYEVALVTPAALPGECLAENIFSVNASLTFQGQVLARFAASELKAARIAVLADTRQTANLALAEAFNKEFSKAGSHPPRQCVYNSEADLAKAIEESKDVKPQAILYAGAATDLAKARTALRAAGLTIPLIFAGDGEHLAALEADSKLGDDICLATPYVLEGGTPGLQEFAEEYQRRLICDGIRVLIQAIHRAKMSSSAKAAADVRAELVKVDGFDSLTGPLTFNKDHSAQRPLFVVRFENGKMREAKRYPEAN